MERVLCKILFEENSELPEMLLMFIERVSSFQRIFCNIYSTLEVPDKGDSGIMQIEPSQSLTTYSYQKIKTLLKKRFSSRQPFFLEVYAVGGACIGVVKIEGYILVHICADWQLFFAGKMPLLPLLQSAFVSNKGTVAYACMAEDNWWFSGSNISKNNWRRAMYRRYNRCQYDAAVMRQQFMNDEIWFPACWRIWINKSILGDTVYQKLLSYRHYHSVQLLDNGCLTMQLYKNIFEYEMSANLFKCREFYIYLGQYYPYNW